MAPQPPGRGTDHDRGRVNDTKLHRHAKWSMGILNDKHTIEVPGSVLLLSNDHNEPLGMRNVPARISHSSIPVGIPFEAPALPGPSEAAPTSDHVAQEKKRTPDGAIILEPQPEDSANDPLNWPAWRRDIALLSLGFYCMLGGGMTPVIAAGFTNVAEDYGVSVETVALSTGIYMAGLGIGSVLASPTAILFGKRPVYLGSVILFIGTSLWAGLSPNFSSLLAARIFQGIAVSPVECLPSATIAEIFFLHERAYRIGIYTLLLLGGKNLVPLVSAAIIGQFGWRWVFFIVAMIVGFAGVLLFLFVPETFWDRTPTAKKASKNVSLLRRFSHRKGDNHDDSAQSAAAVAHSHHQSETPPSPGLAGRHTDLHVGFASISGPATGNADDSGMNPSPTNGSSREPAASTGEVPSDDAGRKVASPKADALTDIARGSLETVSQIQTSPDADAEKLDPPLGTLTHTYTHRLRQGPAQSFVQQLKPYHGRLNQDSWWKVMLRPFILFAYPAVLWSAIVYACSIGWLIVMSETLAIIYRNPATYNFTALQTGLVYVSPFIGGILGTGVAGKVSDIIVRAMARRNGGLYEPEYRLVMAMPILITTGAGLIGFGWAAEEKDAWIVPTIFFGLVSFGCSLGSTTSITFCVDSYRQYAGEALVTLNFSKNIFHGLVFSLFVSRWLANDGSKAVYMWLGIIQILLCLLSIPMYIFGKRARMWTVRMNWMEKF